MYSYDLGLQRQKIIMNSTYNHRSSKIWMQLKKHV